jgi:hypothetical protein
MGMVERGASDEKVTEVSEKQWSVASGQWPVKPKPPLPANVISGNSQNLVTGIASRRTD